MLTRNRFEVVFYKPDGRTLTPARTVRLRSLVFARAASRRMLAPHTVVTTRDTYHRDVARAHSAMIVRPGGRREFMGPPVGIVPSVGELGYTP